MEPAEVELIEPPSLAYTSTPMFLLLPCQVGDERAARRRRAAAHGRPGRGARAARHHLPHRAAATTSSGQARRRSISWPSRPHRHRLDEAQAAARIGWHPPIPASARRFGDTCWRRTDVRRRRRTDVRRRRRRTDVRRRRTDAGRR
jgi:hypothetical protein